MEMTSPLIFNNNKKNLLPGHLIMKNSLKHVKQSKEGKNKGWMIQLKFVVKIRILVTTSLK